MGLYSSFYASLSGLSASSSALSVIGNNLANLNTDGFKGGSANFADLFNSAVANQGSEGNGNPLQVGLGSSLGSVETNFSQGSFQQTGSPTDMALQGAGFFTVQSNGTQLYTRNGNFTINNSGALVDGDGAAVLGWNVTAATDLISTGSVPTAIKINSAATSPGVATKNVTIDGNLDSTATSGTTYTSTAALYDSLGASQSLSITFTAQGTSTLNGATVSTWGVTAKASGGGTPSGFPASVTFDSNGNLVGYTPSGGTIQALSAVDATGASTYVNPQISITGWTDGAADMVPGAGAAAGTAINWNLATISGTNAPVANITSYASASTTAATTQDGFGAGTLSSMSVNSSGVIEGSYSNGQTIPLAQVAISTFINQNGLVKVGNNDWATTQASGIAAIGTASAGGRGSVLGSNLELSNVDVATELTQMIVNQNGYQANSKVITTADTLLQSVLNLIQ